MNDESKDLLTQFIDYTIERTAKIIPSSIKYIEFDSGLQHIAVHYDEQIKEALNFGSEQKKKRFVYSCRSSYNVIIFQNSVNSPYLPKSSKVTQTQRTPTFSLLVSHILSISACVSANEINISDVKCGAIVIGTNSIINYGVIDYETRVGIYDRYNEKQIFMDRSLTFTSYSLFRFLRFSMRLVVLTGSRDVDDVRFQNISYLRSFNSDVA
uniref:Uncharacterized protein n=1 Tax=Glossina pallidipes TaxID=7398 RepID=A0A1B0A6P0_GLOPL